MNALTIFDFEDMPVRSLRIEGEPWVMGSDACRCLTIANPSDALGKLAEDERREINRNTLGISEGNRGNPNAIFINEPGLYRLIFSSTKPEAERFRRFVFHEVLPAIRRTGRFETEGIDWDATAAKLQLIKQARLTHGRKAAQELWARLGLPDVGEDGAGKQASHEDDLLTYVRDFLEECTEAGVGLMVQSSELHKLYGAWASANKAPHFTMVMFGRVIRQAGIRIRQARWTYYLGIRIRHDVRARLTGLP